MTPKAVPVVLRRKGEKLEVLVFAHPKTGTQIVKGSVEPGESVQQAASRELAEEAGIAGAKCLRDLGIWENSASNQIWHFSEMSVAQELQDSWTHFTKDDGGHVFQFSWHPIDEPAPATCHSIFVCALDFLRKQLAVKAHETQLTIASGAA
jgi:8-oxo-dGTP pyrophosphatase MutT (NUDIX family)